MTEALRSRLKDGQQQRQPRQEQKHHDRTTHTKTKHTHTQAKTTCHEQPPTYCCCCSCCGYLRTAVSSTVLLPLRLMGSCRNYRHGRQMSQHNAATRLLVTLLTHIVVNLLFCNNSRPISEQLYQAAPGHMGFWHNYPKLWSRPRATSFHNVIMYVESRWTYSFWASADLRKAARWRTGGGSSSYVSCGWSSNGIIVMSVMVEQTSCLLLLLLWLYFCCCLCTCLCRRSCCRQRCDCCAQACCRTLPNPTDLLVAQPRQPIAMSFALPFCRPEVLLVA